MEASKIVGSSFLRMKEMDNEDIVCLSKMFVYHRSQDERKAI